MSYLIAEIGQNHNGSVDLAKLIIDLTSREIIDKFDSTKVKGIDAVKLTKRDLKNELSASEMNRKYESIHSFGKTYGQHREYLELSDEQHLEIYNYAKSKDLDFVETLCGINCLSLLKLFLPDKLKVASRDLTNLPLLEAMAETNIPIILSTGMSGLSEIHDAVNSISKFHDKISILHCLSQYPAEYQNINLKSIYFLKKEFPNYKIGYSDHSIGISIPTAAVAMGAEIIEKHVTIDRDLKGSDHKGSLSVVGIEKMVRDIRNLERALGKEILFESEAIKETKLKLERSLASNCPIKKGELITVDKLHLLSPGTGFKWNQKDLVLNKKAKMNISKDEIINKEHI